MLPRPIHHLAAVLLTRRSIVLLAALALLLSIVTTASAWFTDARLHPRSHSQVLFPSVAVDSSGMAHAVWLNTEDLNFSDGEVFYVRGQINASGTDIEWEQRQEIFSGRASNGRPARVHVDDNGVVHVVFGVDQGRGNRFVYYMRNGERGARGNWSRETAARPDAIFFTPDFNLDAAGNPVIAWGEDIGPNKSKVRIAYRTGRNAWAVVEPFDASDRGYLMTRPRVAVRGSGAGATVHVMYSRQRNEGEDQDVGYIRGQRAGPYSVTIFNDSFGLREKSDFPDITIDRTTDTIYAGFVYNDSTNQFSLGFTRSEDNGRTWAEPATLRNVGSSHVGAPSLDAVNGVAHFVTEQKSPTQGGYRVELIYYRTFTRATQDYSEVELISNPGERGSFPRISVGDRGKVVVWPRNNTQGVMYNLDPHTLVIGTPTPSPSPTNTPTPSPTPTPPNPVGSIDVRGDVSADVSRGSVDVTFDVQSGNANAYRLSNDGLNFTDPTPLPVSNVVSGWPLAPSDAGAACQNRTVSGYLVNTANGLESELLTDEILFDPDVDLNVDISNPFMSSNNLQQLAGGQVQDFGGSGASNGDPDYTRSEFFYARVSPGAGECSGLSNVTVNGIPLTVDANVASAVVPIADFEVPDGTYSDIEVAATDGAGNQRSLNVFRIILDRVPPEFSNPLTATLTVLDQASQPISGTDSAQVNLRFTNLNITDVGYGDNNDQPFWGMWIANSTEPITDATSTAALTELDWQPVRVEQATLADQADTYSFVVDNWSVLAGVSMPTGQRTQYILARPLDGAGNPSAQMLMSEPLEVSQNSVPPALYLPALRR